jgi:hypothetical protein
MAPTKRKRRRKHRGTQGGSIDRRARRGRPRTREEARAQARKRAEVRRAATAPSWGTAFRRGLIGAVIFFALMVIAFGRTVGEAGILGIVMLGMYVPLGYYVDRFFWRRRRQQEIKARQEAKQAKRS